MTAVDDALRSARLAAELDGNQCRTLAGPMPRRTLADEHGRY